MCARSNEGRVVGDGGGCMEPVLGYGVGREGPGSGDVREFKGRETGCRGWPRPCSFSGGG